MSIENLQTITENNMKIQAVLGVMTQATVGVIEADLVSLVDILNDYANSTDKILSAYV